MCEREKRVHASDGNFMSSSYFLMSLPRAIPSSAVSDVRHGGVADPQSWGGASATLKITTASLQNCPLMASLLLRQLVPDPLVPSLFDGGVGHDGERDGYSYHPRPEIKCSK